MSLDNKITPFVHSLFIWAKNNTRNFPWRKTSDPYTILIAEIMLQRTRAEQALPVFTNFIRAYPDPDSLTKASLKERKKNIPKETYFRNKEPFFIERT